MTPLTPAHRVYLDWNATAPLRPEARQAAMAAADLLGNPSSVHAEGRSARAVVDGARDAVAGLVAAAPANVTFTSGATEANATVLMAGWDTILVANSEHDSVLAAANRSGARVVLLPTHSSGIVAVEAIADEVLRGAQPLGRALLSLQLANNETGVIQPIAEVADFCRTHGLFMHTDAVQAVGRIEVDFGQLGVDYLVMSAHKIGGPKGIGALIMRDGVPFSALITGGGQERRRRGGTENVAGIAGFGAAALAAKSDLQKSDRVSARRDRLEKSLIAQSPETIIVGVDAPRLGNTTCFAVRGHSAETLVIKYDLAGFAVSAGAACSSGKVAASHVLVAMGLAPEVARGAVRVSLGPTTTDDDVSAFLAVSKSILRSTALAA